MSDARFTISEFHQEEGCWLDDDGKHVWFAHWCKDPIDEADLPKPVAYADTSTRRYDVSMLPWPNWQTLDEGQSVYPSIHCEKCGFHKTANLGRRVP